MLRNGTRKQSPFRHAFRVRNIFAGVFALLILAFAIDYANLAESFEQFSITKQLDLLEGQTTVIINSNLDSIEKPTPTNNQKATPSKPVDRNSKGAENIPDDGDQLPNPSSSIEQHKRNVPVEDSGADVTPKNTRKELKPPSFDESQTNVLGKKLKINQELATRQWYILNQRKEEGKPCLSFMHIPKTGGTTVEDVAYPYGVKWGYRLWRNEKLGETVYKREIKGVPMITDGEFGEPWHAPISLYDRNKSKLPIGDCNLFAVVRNPYTRWVSRYNSHWFGYDGPDGNNPKNLNKWVNEQLDALENSKMVFASHRAPQWVHYYDQYSGKRLEQMKHTLRFEELFEQRNVTAFNNLMEEYGLLIRMDFSAMKHSQKGFSGKRHEFNPSTFSQKTRDRIYKFYQKDFELFGYSRDWGKSNFVGMESGTVGEDKITEP